MTESLIGKSVEIGQDIAGWTVNEIMDAQDNVNPLRLVFHRRVGENDEYVFYPCNKRVVLERVIEYLRTTQPDVVFPPAQWIA